MASADGRAVRGGARFFGCRGRGRLRRVPQAARRRCSDRTPSLPSTRSRRRTFRGLSYFPYRRELRIRVPVLPSAGEERPPRFELPEGTMRVRRFARVVFPSGIPGLDGATLSLYWVEGYGGGLFLPFKDATNGAKTYGGGRYLYDTIKGADLGGGNGELILDFNYAYTIPRARTTRAGSARSRHGRTRCRQLLKRESSPSRRPQPARRDSTSLRSGRAFITPFVLAVRAPAALANRTARESSAAPRLSSLPRRPSFPLPNGLDHLHEERSHEGIAAPRCIHRLHREPGNAVSARSGSPRRFRPARGWPRRERVRA